MEDSSWCLFMMDEFYPPMADGEYTCYEGDMIEDWGTFDLRGSPTASSERDGGAGAKKPPQS
jgi:hypothetical protein